MQKTGDEIRTAVREEYGAIARTGGSCCTGGACGTSTAEAIGYSPDDLAAAPDGANLGLGCGNPLLIASLAPGEVVLDLGSGAGFDCFLAAKRVGPTGRVIGVDMTPDMITRARANARKVESHNVEFRLGEIEHLPVADASIDVIMSNCVINLSPDKAAVFREAFRVLRPGGRLAISDMVAVREIPPSMRDDVAALTGCLAGAASVDEIHDALARAGFDEIRLAPDRTSDSPVVSTVIEARRLRAQ
jgi:SAM-dependent methyltransferase